MQNLNKFFWLHIKWECIAKNNTWKPALPNFALNCVASIFWPASMMSSVSQLPDSIMDLSHLYSVNCSLSIHGCFGGGSDTLQQSTSTTLLWCWLLVHCLFLAYCSCEESINFCACILPLHVLFAVSVSEFTGSSFISKVVDHNVAIWRNEFIRVFHKLTARSFWCVSLEVAMSSLRLVVYSVASSLHCLPTCTDHITNHLWKW